MGLEHPLLQERGEILQRPQTQQGNSRQHKERLLGFILDRVKGAPLGDGAIRLTGYHQKTGQVTFQDVILQEDMILVARFYHWPSGRTASTPWDKGLKSQYQPLLESEKWLAAWTVVRLTKLSESCKVMVAGAMKEGHGIPLWNTGTHTLTLFHAPVPPVSALSVMSAEQKHQDYKMYGDATLRLHIFSTQKPELPFPPESPSALDSVKMWPREAFIHHVREIPSIEPFGPGDGFDLYIDGARFLPDDVTIIYLPLPFRIGPDIYTGIDLNSSIFDPIYNYSIEIREPAIPPCATLLLKVYSIDRSSSSLIQIGWAALNLFVESGTYTALEPGAKGSQVSLNDGAHQLRIFHNSPCPAQPFSTSTLTSIGRYVPCATLLVRLLKAPVDSSHQTLQRNMVSKTNWVKLGLFQPRPEYFDGVYYSDSAKPTTGESCLYEAMANRSVVSVRECVHQLTGHSKNRSTDDEISTWIHKKLTRVPGSSPQPFNLTYVSRYIPTYGIKFAVERAMNLPWPGLTMVHFCFNPPGAFYFGSQWLKYDYPIFVEELDINSYQHCPAWLDGFKACPHRAYHEYSTVIIHLYEHVVVNPARDALDEKENVQAAQRRAMLKGERLSYPLESQAWTVLHVFSRGYCNTGIYQLPLYKGAPSQIMLASLSQGKCSSIMKSMLHKKVIQLVPGASVIVCIADGRWNEKFRYSLLDIDQSYLPKKALDLYNKESSGVKIAELMPQTASQKQTKLLTLEQI
ncbi:uncharacterized protein LOC134413366 [Elgaria multicarinata webbii]|uniref:uncharacterized protein LOC134413366 n=1 Tax=Elgaria multicarinata webbii TaxID=159646 RepID=UPI002FCCBD9C